MNFDYLARQAAAAVVNSLGNFDRDYRPDLHAFRGKSGVKRNGQSVPVDLDAYLTDCFLIPDDDLLLSDGELIQRYFEPAGAILARAIRDLAVEDGVVAIRRHPLPPAGTGVVAEWGEGKNLGLGFVAQYLIKEGLVIRLTLLAGVARFKKGSA